MFVAIPGGLEVRPGMQLSLPNRVAVGSLKGQLWIEGEVVVAVGLADLDWPVRGQVVVKVVLTTGGQPPRVHHEDVADVPFVR